MAMDRLAVLGIVVDPQKAISGAKKASNAIKKVGVSARKSKRDISVLQNALPAMARMAVASARKASRAIKGVGRSALNLKDKIFSLQGALIALGGGLVAKSFISTASSMENLKIQLKTVTGSVADADEAFARLTDFTTRTPYEINEVVTAFTKLKAFGLDPSEKAMTSFGNTAAAMGKELDQMIEAVADAATGEFERLREFGIKAKQQGDEVSLTFQGVTKTIKKDSEAIQGYLMDIGNNQFGGAMSDQMETMSGAVSNLRGDWTLFQDELMNSGPFQLVKGLLNALSESLFGDKKSVASNAKAAGNAITSFVVNSMLGVAGFIDSISGGIKFVARELSGMWGMYRQLPAFVQSVGIVGAFIGGPKIKIIMMGVILALTKIKALLSSDQSLDSLVKQAEALRSVLKTWEGDKETAFKIDPKAVAQSKAQLMMLDAMIARVKANAGELGTGNVAVQAAKESIIEDKEEKISLGGLDIPDNGSYKAALQKTLKDIEDANQQSIRDAAFTSAVKAEEAILKAEEEAAAKVKAAGGGMGEISALHRNSQAEMAHITSVFEERNADLHDAAMARKTKSFGEISAMHQKSQEEMLRTSTVFEERNAELHAAAMARKTTSFNVFKDHFNSGWQEMEQASTPVLEQMADKLVSIFGPNGTFSKGIGDATANMIVFGKSGSDSMKALGQAIMQQVISALVSMGVQTALNFAKEKIFATSSTALGVAQAAVTATAWAPAAAAVSLATFGGNAVGANIGMSSSFALAKGLSSFEGGGFTGSGSRSGGVDGKGGFHAILHPNETVIDHTKSKNKSGNGKSSTVVVQQGNTANVTFTINAVDTAGATRVINEQRGTIISVINQALNERGRPALV
tara:strand:- start:5317 stop:7899 length:2583 start_codon:yes stop_codon:yes gene_type:complete